MNSTRRIAHLAAGTSAGLWGCDTTSPRQAAGAESAVYHERPRDESKSEKMKLTIGKKAFTAPLISSSEAS
ncbi:hypothetical protein [Singulisphaera acidiphila]|uniref:Uncharacterized protein n=1 Tax=Singulisphaera acidiphila (strain ATCC BAA-1392 / DSM 18658 / VKM B-2454 / MOB10) TaxID=886293 RepID=L0DPR6_SINAD|nr:hypothetical protein [Singulisphaera acidiphila]AGA30838.1 hypothetical protein Sinac_6770 [Singulisphaera acidiphila DSM 18658]